MPGVKLWQRLLQGRGEVNSNLIAPPLMGRPVPPPPEPSVALFLVASMKAGALVWKGSSLSEPI